MQFCGRGLIPARPFMFTRHLFGGPRRPAVLLIPPRPTSNSSLFLALSREGIALLQECESYLFFFHSFAHSLRKTPGMASRAFLQLGFRVSTFVTLVRSGPRDRSASHSISTTSALFCENTRVSGCEGLYLQTLREEVVLANLERKNGASRAFVDLRRFLPTFKPSNLQTFQRSISFIRNTYKNGGVGAWLTEHRS
jgi:hypothetical protein